MNLGMTEEGRSLVRAAHADALKRGLYAPSCYMGSNPDEYWAEGTQIWFESNRLTVVDGTRILNREDLASYDPALYAVLARAYGDVTRLAGDPFYRHPARVPPGPIPENTAEVC